MLVVWSTLSLQPYHSSLPDPVKDMPIAKKGRIMAVNGVPIWHLTVPIARANLEAQKGLNVAVGMLPPPPLEALSSGSPYRSSLDVLARPLAFFGGGGFGYWNWASATQACPAESFPSSWTISPFLRMLVSGISVSARSRYLSMMPDLYLHLVMRRHEKYQSRSALPDTCLDGCGKLLMPPTARDVDVELLLSILWVSPPHSLDIHAK